MSVIAFVIWMLGCDGVGSPEGLAGDVYRGMYALTICDGHAASWTSFQFCGSIMCSHERKSCLAFSNCAARYARCCLSRTEASPIACASRSSASSSA